ncbi:MAG: hypothetical protein PVH12_04970, partial [Candidatus Bathyarchaeota archaeon]
ATGFFLYYYRQVEKKLREVGATSEETAKTIEELKQLGLSQPCITFLKDPLRRGLARMGGNKIKETSDGRYYV